MSTTENICKSISEANNDGVFDMNDKLQNMSLVNNKEDVSAVCANCGKEGSDVNNICNKCKKAKYCNAVCKKAHKKKHKKQCEEHVRLATEKHNEELIIAAELHDIKLFKQPPPLGDCPICFLRMPTLQTGGKYYLCCGKVICSGCIHAPVYDNQGNQVDNKKCPFCRAPAAITEAEMLKRNKKRMKAGDPIAICRTGNWYVDGLYGFPQDYNKGLELYLRAGELGYSAAYNGIGSAYEMGIGVEVDMKKATYYYELEAMGGDEIARHNVGVSEANAGNLDRALKHWMIAVRSGCAKSLEIIKQFYGYGQVTKDDYKKALRLYQEYLGEIKSPQRDKAAEYSERYRYY